MIPFLGDFLDWVQDAVRERYRQTVKSSEANRSWKSYLVESYEAGQAWLVVSLVGKSNLLRDDLVC